jgi:hypothetical protein
VGNLLAIWRRKVSLAVHVARADNVLRGLSAAVDGAEVASSSVGMPSPTTALFTRAMGRKRPCASRAACEAPLVGLSHVFVALSALPRSFLILVC